MGSTSSTATVVLALGLGAASIAVDVAARAAAISAVPAVVALHLLLASVATSILALVIGRAEQAPGRRAQPPWLLVAAAVVGALAAAARARAGATVPSTVAVAPLVVAGPALLAAELARRARAGERPGPGWPHRLLTAGYLVGAAMLMAVSLGPQRWDQVEVAAAEARAVALALTVAATLQGALLARRRPRAAVRSASIALVAGASAIATPTSGSPGLVAALAGLTIGAIVLLTTERARRRIDIESVVLTQLPAAGRRSARALVATARRAGRGARRAARPVVATATVSARPRRALTRGDRVAAGAMAAVSLAFVASGVAWAVRVGYQPTAHAATYLARAFDVGTRNHPLVGITTSLGADGEASHPGPMLMDLLAPFVRALGVQQGAIAGGAAIALTCWAVATWAAWRAAGRTAAVAAWATSAVVIEVAALGAVWEANNVSTGMLAMFATVLACWATATGAWKHWWWAVALGTLVTQSYLAHALIVIGPIVWSGLVLATTARRGAAEDRGGARRALRGGLLIGVVLWFQPLLDVVLNDGGNVRILFDQVTDPRPPVGPIGFPQTVAWIFTVPPRWDELTRTFAQAGNAQDFLGGPWMVGALLATVVAAATLATWRRCTSGERQLRIVIATMIVGAGVNATRLPAEYLRSFSLGWLVVAGVTAWFAVGLSLLLAAQRRVAATTPSSRRTLALRAAGGAAAFLLVVGCALARPDRIQDLKGQAFTIDAMVRPIVDQTIRNLPTDDQVLVLGLDTRLTGVAHDTIVPNLIVDGVDARVEVANGYHYGRRRQVYGDWSGPMLWVVSGMSPIKPEGERLARASMPGWTRDDYDRAAAAVARAVRSAPEVELEPFIVAALPRYLAGWVEDDVCTVADDLAAGRADPRDLPDGALLAIAADLGFTSPVLSPDLQEQASDVVGQAPLEVWFVERTEPAHPVGDLLTRDDQTCPAVVSP